MIIVFFPSKNKLELKLIKPSSIIKVDIKMEKQELLKQIHDWFRQQNININNLVAIAVVYEPASFSMLRTVTAIANTMSWSLDIPVFKIKGNKTDDKALAKSLKNRLKTKTGKSFIVPEYFKEPNIT